MAAEGIETQVRQLREAGLTPKLIARKLGVPMSTVAGAVAAVAAQRRPSDELVGCWVSPGWSRGPTVGANRQWPDSLVELNGSVGLAAVLVARRHRYDKVSVCGYLTDVHCLGVKNLLGPEVMDDLELRGFMRQFFATFGGEPVPAPLELAQHLVLGAVEYARGLGFEPHPDFAAAAGHLGVLAGPSDITFGHDGRPFYVQGPYDDAAAILKTLNRTVGRGKYHYTVGLA